MHTWMKRSKKALALILALVMVATVFPAAAVAYATEEPSALPPVVDLTQNLYTDNIVSEEEVAEIIARAEASVEMPEVPIETPAETSVEIETLSGGRETLAEWRLATGDLPANAPGAGNRTAPATGGSLEDIAQLQFFVNLPAERETPGDVTTPLVARRLTFQVGGANVRNAAGDNQGGLNNAANNAAPPNHAWWQISLDTRDFSDLEVSWEMQSAGTGPRDFQLQYSLVGGTDAANWTNVGGPVIITQSGDGNGHAMGNIPNREDNVFTIELPEAVEDEESVYLRLVITSNLSARNGLPNNASTIAGTEAMAGTGAHRINDIVITGANESSDPGPAVTHTIAQARAVGVVGSGPGTFVTVEGDITGSQAANVAFMQAANASGPNDGIMVQVTGAANFIGQRVRVSGYVRTMQGHLRINANDNNTAAPVTPHFVANFPTPIIPIPITLAQAETGFQGMLVSLAHPVQIATRTGDTLANHPLEGTGTELRANFTFPAALNNLDVQGGDWVNIHRGHVLYFNQTHQIYSSTSNSLADITGITHANRISVYTPSTTPTISVAAQTGTLTAGAAGSAAFVVTTAHIDDGTAITLNGAPTWATLATTTTTTTGNSTTITIDVTTAAVAGTYPLTLTATVGSETITSNSFNLVVDAAGGPTVISIADANIAPVGTTVRIAGRARLDMSAAGTGGLLGNLFVQDGTDPQDGILVWNGGVGGFGSLADYDNQWVEVTGTITTNGPWNRVLNLHNSGEATSSGTIEVAQAEGRTPFPPIDVTLADIFNGDYMFMRVALSPVQFGANDDRASFLTAPGVNTAASAGRSHFIMEPGAGGRRIELRPPQAAANAANPLDAYATGQWINITDAYVTWLPARNAIQIIRAVTESVAEVPIAPITASPASGESLIVGEQVTLSTPTVGAVIVYHVNNGPWQEAVGNTVQVEVDGFIAGAATISAFARLGSIESAPATFTYYETDGPARAREAIVMWELPNDTAFNANWNGTTRMLGATGGPHRSGATLQFLTSAPGGAAPFQARNLNRTGSGANVLSPTDAANNVGPLTGGEAWWQARVSTRDFANINVTWEQRVSNNNTAPQNWRLEFRVGETGSWTPVPIAVPVANVGGSYAMSGTGLTTYTSGVFPVGANNQDVLYLRWMVTTNSTAGTTQIQNIVITGEDPDIALYSNPPGGSVLPVEGQTVTLSTTAPGATIVYSLNGGPWVASVEAGDPVDVFVTFSHGRTATIQAFLRTGAVETRVVTFTYSRPAEMSIADANAMSLGEFVIIEGYATRITGTSQLDSQNLWVQDDSGNPHSGIVVRSRTVSLESYVGQRVRAAGERTIFRGLNQIDIGFGTGSSLDGGMGSITRHGAGAPDVTPVVWTGDLRGSGYRFMRISLDSVEFLAGEESLVTPLPPVGMDILACPDGTRIELQVAENSPLQPDALESGDWISIDFAYVGWNDLRGAVQLLGAQISRADAPLVRHITATPQSGAVIPELGTVRLETETQGAQIRYRVNGGEWQTSASNVVDVTIPAFDQEGDTAVIEAYAVLGADRTPSRTFTYTQAAVAPVLPNPFSGRIRPDTTVTLETATPDARIYFSINGGQPTFYADGILVTGAMLSAPVYIEAWATAPGFLYSERLELRFELRDMRSGDVFFGQLHAHTGMSDGTGTPAEAFAEARDIAGLDFFGLSDHSNDFDWGFVDGPGSPIAGPEDLWPVLNLREYQRWGSNAWEVSRAAAEAAREEGVFLSTTGFEFTWGGGPGHMNTFNTTGWVCRRNAWLNIGGNNDQRLLNYYELLRNTPESVSMFNHPGTTFGNFNNFAHFDPQTAARIPLIEVANGSGAIGMGGYFPAYEQFTMALDRGWLLAPANSQDNHTGNFGFANEGRVAIYTNNFTYEGMWQALRDRAAYSTEIRDMEIIYYAEFESGGATIREPMGSMISTVPDEVRFEADIYVPNPSMVYFPGLEPDDPPLRAYRDSYTVQFAELVTNGGVRLGRQYFNDGLGMPNGQPALYEFTMSNPEPGYYYLWIISTSDRDGSQRIAVTAPIWIGRAPLVGISEVTADRFMPVTGEPVELTTHFFNDHGTAVTVLTLEFFLGGGDTPFATLTPNLVIQPGEMPTISYSFTPDFPGIDSIHVRAIINVDGSHRTYTGFVDIVTYANETTGRIGIDAAHFNEGVDGRSRDSFTNFARMAASMNLVTSVFRTDADIIAAANDPRYQLLLFAPPGRDGGILDRGYHRVYSQEVLDAVSDFADGGGTVVVTGLRNLIDGSGRIPGIDGASSHQQNRLLAALGSHIRVADAGHNAPVGWRYTPESTGHMHRLRYRHNFNLDNPFMTGVQPHPGGATGRGQTFRVFNTGALYTVNDPNALITSAELDAAHVQRGSLPTGVDPMIFAHPNSSVNDGNSDQGMGRTKFPLQNNFPRYSSTYRGGDPNVGTGNQVLMAASERVGDGYVVVFASNFFSNFDVAPEIDFFGQLPTANSTIAENLLRRVEPEPVITPIADVREATPGRGSWFTIEGTVMSNPMSPPAGHARGFTNSLYIEDDSGGINIFEVSRGMVVGQTVRAYGYVSSYQGETQLTIHLGGSISVIDGAINERPWTDRTIEQALSGAFMGDLVRVEGEVSNVVVQGGAMQFTLTDDDDNAIPVFMRAYITPGVNLDFVVDGAWVSVVGFSSHGETMGGANMHRIRPRDRNEIESALDLRALAAAITAANARVENNYTPASWAAVNRDGAVSAAQAVLNDLNATQQQVDAAVTALNTALAGLAARANREALAAAITAANGRVENNYTPASWAAVNRDGAVSAAQAVLNDLNATQQQVDAAVTALNAALAGLAARANTEALAAAITAANARVESN
ncbi:MAG: chitobiase/beta-hexosaminidase C-terminal domain-containing protein, partial [Oscillospiraceae bacterium]|nr:chitobiase/beta-hexosaminidase C-terminal domain-containing protein [Oscillospiraceae bacterium]